MVDVFYNDAFQKSFAKLKTTPLYGQVKKRIRKIIEDPEVGKPMRYARKDTREVYVGSFRLSYAYIKDENRLVFLDIYHKDQQ